VGAGAPQNNDSVTRFEQGRPLWYFYGYKTDGIDPATGKVIKVDTDGVPGITSNENNNWISSTQFTFLEEVLICLIKVSISI
jgi:hypothetical protein